MLTIENHGPLIMRTNYWETELAAGGKLFLSTNAGAFRLLVPPAHESLISEVRTSTEVIVSRGPWPAGGQADAVEILFEDGSDEPYSIQLDLRSCDRVPVDEDQGRELIFTCWTRPRRGRPHKAYERPAWYRRVRRLPCLQPQSLRRID